MKISILLIALVLGFTGCHVAKKYETSAAESAQKAGLTPLQKSHFDVTYVASSANFSEYKNLLIDELDFSAVKIISPSNRHAFDRPWELDESDKHYYEEKFSAATKNKLIDTGLFKQVNTADKNTLELKTKILEIAPLATKDDIKSRPNFVKVYSEGFGKMTISFEFYDATTHQLVATATDQHDLGSIWEENNRLQNNAQIRLAFDYWVENLKKEWESVAHK